MKQSSFSDLEHLELLARRIAESGIDITSTYEDWITITFACASLGEPARESYQLICSRYPGYQREECDQKFDNCLRTGRGDIRLGTLIQLAKDHGIDTSLPRGPRPKTEAQRKEERENRFQLMQQLIGEWMDVRFNLWRNRVECRQKGSEEWIPLSDRDLSTFYTRLQSCGVSVKAVDVKALLESRDYCHDYDAVREWLDQLPAYDPERDPDYIRDFFIGHLHFADPENAEFYQQMLQKWFVGMVALWTGSVNENPLMPVFCGQQHIGKTYYIRHLLPPELRQYYKEPSPRDPVDKDFIISLSEVVMIFLDEFSISSNARSDTYKAIITSSQSNLRDAYAHFREVRDRKASLIGATNNKRFIRDAEGNRRYIGIDLVGTENLHERPLNYEGAYAQAIYLLANGYKPKPTHGESTAITQHNVDFLELNDCEEALGTFVRHPRPADELASALLSGEKVQAYSAGELMQELNMRGFHGKDYNANNVGKAMRHLGFTPRKLKGYNKYLVVIADINSNQTERDMDAAEGIRFEADGRNEGNTTLGEATSDEDII